MKYTFTVAEDGTVTFQERDPERGGLTKPRRVISATEAARLLRRSRRHLYRWIHRGWLRPVASFAQQHFLDLADVQALRRSQRSMRTPSLPPRLSPLFPEYDGRRLHLDRDADVILSRILERGDPAAVHWAQRHFALSRRKQFLRRQGARLLSPRTFHFWRWLWRVPRRSHQNWRQPGRELGGLV